MSLALLKTKLYVPPIRSELVSRPRLIERIDAGIHSGHKLTLVSAPAGFGKTTLLSEWIHQNTHPIAWLSLNDSDNEPTRFWTYVLAALRTIPALGKAGVGESALAMLHSPQSPPIETLLTNLINDIAEIAFVAPPPGLSLFVLVLDDFQVIANVQINETLAFLIDNMPQQMHVVIATRSDPDLPLSRLRGRGQLTELSAADLRFTISETTHFFNEVMNLDLADRDVVALEARTEGWIVGLQMAAHALQGTLGRKGSNTTHVSSFIAAFTGSHRYILDYLTDEVLSQEPEQIQTFLLRTSILARLCGSLCEAVTGQVHGQDMLERLDAANLFIVPLDGERQWYRYHHLFAELLRKRLDRTDPGMIPDLHRRASEWYERAGLIEDAITHALTGKDFERAAALIEQNAIQQMGSYRREAALSVWLESLPAALIETRPLLCVYLAWTRYWMGQRERVETCLQNAERALARTPRPADEQLITGYISAIRAHHALTNQDIERVVTEAQQAIQFLPEGDYMRCEAAVALGGAYWSLGDVAASQAAFVQARTTAQKSGYRPLAVPSGCYAGMQQVKQGQLEAAFDTFREALEWATEPGGRLLPVAGFPLLKLADVLREWDDLDSAGQNLDKAIELCVQLGQADVVAECYVTLARLRLAQGCPEDPLDALDQADQIASTVRIDPWITSWADACRLGVWLSIGKLEDAVHWAEASGLSVDGPFSYHHDLHHLNLVRVLLARGIAYASPSDLDQALDLLARLLAAAEKAGWVHEQIKILCLQALALDAQRDGDGALVALERALALAEPGGYVRIFVDEGTPMATLLRRVAERDIAPAYTSKLLLSFGEHAIEQATIEKTDGSPMLEPLSEREIEILQLIAQGLSNREIGEQLFISQGTVKAHTSNIYGKLGVRSRTQAVAQARDWGLL
ncbi:MAG: hypothetical protein JXA89_28460 [Anaerolineae bacterium]|nr:hypothetical protein [Anaerolineae bacterium]